MIQVLLNEQQVCADVCDGTVLLDFVRDNQLLTGTKEACREGECGACTVLVGSLTPEGELRYRSVASCLLPVGDVVGSHVVTVEGLGDELTLVQRLILKHSASQCGFCTPGVVLSLTAFCLTSEGFSYEDALDALDGNLCRCTGYRSIRAAAKELCEVLSGVDKSAQRRVEVLVHEGVLPRYFEGIGSRLAVMKQEIVEKMGEVATQGEGQDGQETLLIAGGTDMFVQRPGQLRRAQLHFLSRRHDLQYIRCDAECLRVGGAITIEQFRTSNLVREHFPRLWHDLLLHSSAILRNRATLTGNLVNASPIGDISIILLALGARVVVQKHDKTERQIHLNRFFLGYRKPDLDRGEVISEIVIPLLGQGQTYRFEKVSNRVTLDIAAVNSGFWVQVSPGGELAGLRISAGGVAPIPLLFDDFEVFYGKTVTAQLAKGIASKVAGEVKPIDDIRGSARYKQLLLHQLVLAHFMELQDSLEQRDSSLANEGRQ